MAPGRIRPTACGSSTAPAAIGRPVKPPSILCLSFSDLTRDPRVRRQIRLLQQLGDVTAAGYVGVGLEGIRFVDVASPKKRLFRSLATAFRLKLRRFESYYWKINCVQRAMTALRGRTFDLVVGNDADTWPLALALRGSGRVLFDAHEFAPREFEDIWWWRVFMLPARDYLCRKYLGKADQVVTVCQGIADEMHRCYGVRPQVVMNAAPYRPLWSRPAPAGPIRMIHHGLALRSRKIENMIEAMDHLDERFELDLMLLGEDTRYLDSLRSLARARPRVRFRPPVPADRIPEETRNYDIGLFLLEPTNFNYLHALPNKFFEFVQARLAIAIGPSPEMARLVRKHDLGVVADDFSPAALARALNPLTPELISRYQANADRAAPVLCWEHESETLLGEARRLLGSNPCAA